MVIIALNYLSLLVLIFTLKIKICQEFPRDVRFFGASMSPRWGAGGHARGAERVGARSATFCENRVFYRFFIVFFKGIFQQKVVLNHCATISHFFQNFPFFSNFWDFFPKFHLFLNLISLFRSGDVTEFSFLQPKICMFLAGNKRHGRAAPASYRHSVQEINTIAIVGWTSD